MVKLDTTNTVENIERETTEISQITIAIEDTRKPLVERLPLAWDLLLRKNVYFPGRRQHLLDWLLDASYRLFKASEARIREALSRELYWSLLVSLLRGTGDITGINSAINRKRKVNDDGFYFFSKPILPIFTTYFRHHLNPSLVDNLVCDTLNCLIQGDGDINKIEYIMRKTSFNSVREFISFIKFPVEQAHFLLLWLEHSGHDYKIVIDLLESIIHLYQALDALSAKELCEQVLSKALLSRPILCKIQEEALINSMATLDKLQAVEKVNLFHGIIEKGRQSFELAHYRMVLVQVFLHLVANIEGDRAFEGLVNELKKGGFASNQSDEPWSKLQEFFKAQVKCCHNKPLIIQSIAEFELTLVQGEMNSILSSIQEHDEPNLNMLGSLVRLHSQTRQLDQFIPQLLEYLTIPAPLLFWRNDLRPELQKLYQRALGAILQRLRAVVKCSISAKNALLLLRVLIPLDFKLIGKVIPDIKDWRVTFPEAELEFWYLIEDLALYQPEILTQEEEAAVTAIDKLELTDGLRLQLYLKGRIPSLDCSQLSSETIKKYLLVLMSNAIEFPLSAISDPVLLDSTLFWEIIPNISDLVRANIDNLEYLELLVRKKPKTLVVDAELAVQLLNLFPNLADDVVIEGQSFPPNFVLSQLDPSISDQACLKLYRLGALSIDLIWEKVLNNPNSLNSISLVKEILETSSDEQCQMLVEQYFSISGEFSIEGLAVLSKRIPTLYQQTVHRLPRFPKLLIASQFIEIGDPTQVDIELSQAVTDYLQGNERLTDPRTIIKFIRSHDELKSVLSVIEPSQLEPSSRRRWLELADVLLLQPLDIQTIICHHLDSVLLTRTFIQYCQSKEEVSLATRLLHHRLLCGGTNIGALQLTSAFEGVMNLTAWLVKWLSQDIIEELCSILTNLIKFHWTLLISRRPLFIAFLTALIKQATLAPRRIARLLGDFAALRQADQHYYVAPLILTFVHQDFSLTIRYSLTPSLCALLRYLDQHRYTLRTDPAHSKEKYFDADPWERMMLQTENDDAKLLLRDLFKTYQDHYKFTGKA